MNKYSIIFAPHVVERGRVGDVAHREMGYIPFCTPAPHSGIYRPISREQAERENWERADRFAFVLEDEQTGTRCGNFAEPIFGAFGEAL